MTHATETVREQAFRPLECQVPDGLTLREWRAQRPSGTPKRRGLRARLRRTLR
jgi:hypothetical protein